MKLERSEDCGMHSAADPLPDSRQALQASNSESLSRILQKAKEKWKADSLTWDFDRDLIVGLQCTSCGKHETFVGTSAIYSGTDTCACGGLFKPLITTGYTGTENWGAKNFGELGFPKGHIYCAKTAESRIYFTLRD
jgi:hypothetical protein